MNFEKTTPERIYELGEGAQELTLTKSLGLDINEAPFDVVKESYDEFCTAVSDLHVEMEPPLEELEENTLSDEFLAAQVDRVQRYIKRFFRTSMGQLFRAGKAAELNIF